jgi:hypothetical protein|tara:strand:+ start:196 stop:438 length:243 start_codon:yes stop_codon:yes gene_type:complete
MVLVTWLDTNENSVGGWIEKADLDKSEVCSVDSLGWLYKENDELIVILADKDTHDKDDIYGRSQVIPKGVIKKIQNLQEI